MNNHKQSEMNSGCFFLWRRGGATLKEFYLAYNEYTSFMKPKRLRPYHLIYKGTCFILYPLMNVFEKVAFVGIKKYTLLDWSVNVLGSIKKPLYQQIIDDLKDKIMKGKFSPNDPFPTQIELAKLYGTSEITSRRALTELANEGLIYRIRGKGTFIHDKKTHLPKEETPPQLKRLFFIYKNVEVQSFNHRFYSDMFKGIQEVCQQNNVEFHLINIGETFDLPRYDDAGYIFLSVESDENYSKALTQWKKENKKIMTVHTFYPHLQIPYVVVDNYSGGFLATQHLLSFGHQRIGIVVTGNSLLEMSKEFTLRLQGYRQALLQNQIQFDPELVYVTEGEFESEEMGYKGLNHLMKLTNPPTAIFFTSDCKAVGAMRAASEMGLSIPDDISIVGYDDLVTSEYLMPGLTTINQNTYKVGKRAAEILLFEWDHTLSNGYLKDEIMPKLVVRGSTAEEAKFKMASK